MIIRRGFDVSPSRGHLKKRCGAEVNAFCVLSFFPRCLWGCFTVEPRTSSGRQTVGSKSNRPSPQTDSQWTPRKRRGEEVFIALLVD